MADDRLEFSDDDSAIDDIEAMLTPPRSPRRIGGSPVKRAISPVEVVVGRDRKVRDDLHAHSRYKYVRKIGGGMQVDVYLVEDDGQYFAAKAYEFKLKGSDVEVGKRSEDLLDIFCICKFAHPYIIAKRDFVVGKNYIFVMLEYAQCNIGQYMDSISKDYGDDDPPSNLEVNAVPFTEREKASIIYQVGASVSFIHKAGYVHNDIKPINVLLVNGRPMLTDFGLTRLREEQKYSSQTYSYRAPEHLFVGQGVVDRLYKSMYTVSEMRRWKNNYDRGEIWAFGIFCLSIIYGYTDITYTDQTRQLKLIKKRYIKDPYVTLMRIILEREKEELPAKTSRSSKRRKVSPSEVMYNAIIDVFGEPPDSANMLEVVCEMLLVINQDDRCESLDDFLSDPIFEGMSEHQLKPSIPATIPKTNFSKKGYTVQHVNELVKSMLRDNQESHIPTFCTMDAVDLFLQKFGDYATTVDELVLFASSCIKLVDMMHNVGGKSLGDCAKLCSGWGGKKVTSAKVWDMILRILINEEGTPHIQSTYALSSCVEIVVAASLDMQDYSKYISRGPHGIVEACTPRSKRRTDKKEHCGRLPILG